jgi:hypothetical protein
VIPEKADAAHAAKVGVPRVFRATVSRNARPKSGPSRRRQYHRPQDREGQIRSREMLGGGHLAAAWGDGGVASVVDALDQISAGEDVRAELRLEESTIQRRNLRSSLFRQGDLIIGPLSRCYGTSWSGRRGHVYKNMMQDKKNSSDQTHLRNANVGFRD